MLEQIINVIKDVSLKHKDIQYFKYQDNLLINQQNNNKYLQCIVDDTSIHNLQISQSPRIITASFDVYILGFIKEDDTLLSMQNKCYDAAMHIITKMGDYSDIVDVYDYSIMTLSHFTDDNACGVKITLSLYVPFGVCDIDSHFDSDIPEDKLVESEDKEISLIGTNKDKPITLKPITL